MIRNTLFNQVDLMAYTKIAGYTTAGDIPDKPLTDAWDDCNPEEDCMVFLRNRYAVSI